MEFCLREWDFKVPSQNFKRRLNMAIDINDRFRIQEELRRREAEENVADQETLKAMTTAQLQALAVQFPAEGDDDVVFTADDRYIIRQVIQERKSEVEQNKLAVLRNKPINEVKALAVQFPVDKNEEPINRS